MITFNWKILKLFADCKGIKYYVKAIDGQDFVNVFAEGKY